MPAAELQPAGDPPLHGVAASDPPLVVVEVAPVAVRAPAPGCAINSPIGVTRFPSGIGPRAGCTNRAAVAEWTHDRGGAAMGARRSTPVADAVAAFLGPDLAIAVEYLRRRSDRAGRRAGHAHDPLARRDPTHRDGARRARGRAPTWRGWMSMATSTPRSRRCASACLRADRAAGARRHGADHRDGGAATAAAPDGGGPTPWTSALEAAGRPGDHPHHYDVSNRFYELVLGPSMTYSCGVWASPEISLEEAANAVHF